MANLVTLLIPVVSNDKRVCYLVIVNFYEQIVGVKLKYERNRSFLFPVSFSAIMHSLNIEVPKTLGSDVREVHTSFFLSSRYPT